MIPDAITVLTRHVTNPDGVERMLPGRQHCGQGTIVVTLEEQAERSSTQ
jgi:hypothetical protein